MFFKTAAKRLTAGILSISAMIAPALAVTGTVNTGSSTLNLRAEANTSSSVVAKLSGGTNVEVLNTVDGGWYQISYGSLTGYVASQYVTIQEAVQAASAENTALYGRVTTASLNIRSGPDTTYDKCGSLKSGKVVELLESVDGWYRIEGGYVSAEYIQIMTEEDLASYTVADQVVELALSYVGYPYVYGGSSPSGFDCSGFTSYIYKQFGYTLNRSAANQLDNGTAVSMSELQPGDLVLFKKAGTGSKRASHVGIYIGNHQFVHASTSKVGVIINDLSDAYYTSGFVGGRRIV